MNNLVNSLLPVVGIGVLAALLALVAFFPPPKPHPGNHRETRGTPATLPVRPVLVLPGVDVAARAGQPNAWLRATGRASVPDRCRTYLPARHAAEAVAR